MVIAIYADWERFRGAGTAQRRAADESLVAALGRDWSRASTDDELSTFVHAPTALTFVVVPGGVFEMGLSTADVAEAAAHFDFVAPVAARLAAYRRAAEPVHRVLVSPFLCTRRSLDRDEVARLSGGKLNSVTMKRAEARALAAASGFRLPSEAELEWMARDGGRFHFTLDAAAARNRTSNDDRRLESGFGLQELNDGGWAEDDWHPNYEGAPTDTSPWLNGSDEGVLRGSFWLMAMQDEAELMNALAGVRHRGAGVARVRFALSLAELAATASP